MKLISKMRVQIRNYATTRTSLRFSVLLTIFGMCACVPQSYYSQYPYNNRAGYAGYAAAIQQRRQQPTNRYASSSSLADRYNPNRLRPQTATDRLDTSYLAQSPSNTYRLNRLRAQAAAQSEAASVSPNRLTNNYNSQYHTDAYASTNRLRSHATTDNANDLTNTHTSKLSDATTATLTTTERPGKYRVSRADAENGKFAGTGNQENEEEKTVGLLKRKRFRGQRCGLFGRDAAAVGADSTSAANNAATAEQGRFLFDLNVYNVYQDPIVQQTPQLGGGGCGGFGGGGLGGGLFGGGGLGGGGGGLGGGLFSDPVAQQPVPPLNNFLSLFAPGILQNVLAATVRPRPQFQADLGSTGLGEINDLQNDPQVDPNFNPVPARPIRRPNRVYYDSAGAAPITPAQLVGGVATTVNGLIQQLTGNIQPVYQSYRNAPRSYG